MEVSEGVGDSGAEPSTVEGCTVGGDQHLEAGDQCGYSVGENGRTSENNPVAGVGSVPSITVEDEDEGDPSEAVENPQVNSEEVNVVVPEVGMVFSNEAEVESWYKKYAKEQGFAVIRAQGSYNSKKERRATTWRCECSGDPEMKEKRKSKKKAKQPEVVEPSQTDMGNPKKRESKKCFCTAMVYASMNPNREWVIGKVVLDHANHNPVPSQARLVKEYRMEHFNSSLKRKLVNDLGSGISVGKSHCSMARDRGGYDNMPLTEKDMRHVSDAIRKSKMEGGDCNALVAYFERMQRQNSKFFHTHRLDSQGMMKDIFWVDARSRAAYDEFSDVVCFDTTYLTNQYHLPFANFVGVNHHGQSILFGCALISNEDCDTFEWLFRQWLECMEWKQPGGILTDQAAAMRRPLEVVMPDTRHRWCLWHILQKLPYKLGRHEKYFELKKELLEVVHNSLNNLEFEQGWACVIEKFGLEKCEWLTNLYVERHMWVPSFMTEHFWAGMRSTQRCESINSFFNQFVTRHTMMCEFGEKYVAAIEKRIFQEKDADERSVKWVRNYSTGFSAERFFRKIYTSNKFKVLQRECEKMIYCMVNEEKQVDSNTIEFLVEDRVWVLPAGRSQPVLTSRRVNYCVTFNPENKEACCDCKMFETHGIMCRHTLRLFDKLHIEEIPDKYVLRRWRKDVIRAHTSVRVAYHDHSRTEEVKRLDKLVIAYDALTDLAARSERATDIVLKALRLIQSEVRFALREDGFLDNPPNSQAESNCNSPNGSSTQPVADTLLRKTQSPAVQSQCSENVVNCDASATPGSAGAERVSIIDPPIPKKRGRPKESCAKYGPETGWKCSKKAKGTNSDKTSSPKKKNKKRGNQKGKSVSQDVVETDQEPLDDQNNILEQQQPVKMPVKRKRNVSFVDVAEAPPPFTG